MWSGVIIRIRMDWNFEIRCSYNIRPSSKGWPFSHHWKEPPFAAHDFWHRYYVLLYVWRCYACTLCHGITFENFEQKGEAAFSRFKFYSSLHRSAVCWNKNVQVGSSKATMNNFGRSGKPNKDNFRELGRFLAQNSKKEGKKCAQLWMIFP